MRRLAWLVGSMKFPDNGAGRAGSVGESRARVSGKWTRGLINAATSSLAANLISSS